MTKYFNVFHVFEYGRNILNRLYVSYKRACMAIQSTISDSAYYDYEEQVEAINDSKERVDVISNPEEQVDAVSEAKAYRDYIYRNEFEIMKFFE